ncbi:class I SAM-dependent methyltransferase [Luteimonas aquatica]|uniref:class I SAM-dependent methyltransferase n=1 Tax=Luteimonas aquatica TaxID=450364 RepID=UPI001F58C940|nr:class I SAM-dependent methyltransferase [Luteimonas aquatica]
MTERRDAQNTGESPSLAACADNRRTVEVYERSATSYVQRIASWPSGVDEQALRRVAQIAGEVGTVLEVGSGAGWDADFLESLGVAVRRTDVTQGFLEFQAGRGKRIEALDLLRDDLGGPYGAVVALYVLQHVGRDLTPGVLRKVAAALHPGGAFLVSVQEGTGESWEHGKFGEYLVVRRTLEELEVALSEAGLRLDWHAHNVSEDGPWWIVVARKSADAGG